MLQMEIDFEMSMMIHYFCHINEVSYYLQLLCLKPLVIWLSRSQVLEETFFICKLCCVKMIHCVNIKKIIIDLDDNNHSLQYD